MAAWLTEQFIRQTTRDGETEEYLIAVIGVTGAGKSTFTSKATGDKAVEIGNGLCSCKLHCIISPFIILIKQVPPMYQ
jgi:ABC-type uncharacterized transport system ATPase component